MKATRLLIFLLVFSLLGVAPVAAHGRGSMHGIVEGQETAFVPAPFIPAGRCPAEAGWMLHAAGTGMIEGLGTFTWESAHCSWPVIPTADGVVGLLRAGEMTLTMDASGDQLFVDYQGRWKFHGELSGGQGAALILQSFEFTGGTGEFVGASGGGRMNGLYDTGLIRFRLHGELDD